MSISKVRKDRPTLLRRIGNFFSRKNGQTEPPNENSEEKRDRILFERFLANVKIIYGDERIFESVTPGHIKQRIKEEPKKAIEVYNSAENSDYRFEAANGQKEKIDYELLVDFLFPGFLDSEYGKEHLMEKRIDEFEIE
ncbi:hypothetical protein JXB01_02665 [Candidatus Micrarchaeota archaeon]|nr:hypothetical protein [Candidatus Micrarchaeota archaeon]